MTMDILATIFSGVLGGGATGLLGILIQQWGEHKKRGHDLDVMKQQHLQTLELSRQENEQKLQLANVTTASAERLAEIQAAARAEEMSSEDYRASMDNDRARYLSPEAQKNWFVIVMMGIVDFMRGIIRPGITLYGMAILTMLLTWVHDMWLRSQLNLSPDDTKKLVMEIVGTATYITVTSVVWWFGRRPEAPPKR
jgi:hypothetical protein